MGSIAGAAESAVPCSGRCGPRGSVRSGRPGSWGNAQLRIAEVIEVGRPVFDWRDDQPWAAPVWLASIRFITTPSVPIIVAGACLALVGVGFIRNCAKGKVSR